MHPEKFSLSTADYVIFAAMLVLSSCFGVFFQLTEKKKTHEEYLLGGKDMSLLPVALSLMATFMSATTLMGIPAEMYLYGTNMTFMNLGFILGPIITSFVFLPIFFANGISTAYEYLEIRFGKATRKLVSAMFAFQSILFTAATLYAPALALSAVTDLSLWMSIISIGLVCTFYCTLGGIKAVVWADVFQAVLMYTCLIAIIIKGCLLLGGIGNVFDIANEGGRLVLPSFSFDLGAHYTMFNIFAQGMIITMSSFAGMQCQVQRLLSVKNVKRSITASLLSIPMIVGFQLLCCLCGLIFYAYFKSCDPMTSADSPIQSADQLLPYFIASTLSDLPGLPGLCICGIFSASLSTISSSINSLASVASEDFVRPLYPKFTVLHTKILSVVFGLLCIAVSFLVSSLGHLVKMSVIIVGMLAGPNLAVFLLAACTTATNQEGIILGILASLVIAACLSFIPENKTDPFLPLSNECPLPDSNGTSILYTPPNSNTSSYLSTTTTSAEIVEGGSFHISYMWISSLALIACLVVGYFSSILISFCQEESKEVPEMHLSAVRTWFSSKKPKEKALNLAG
ncbi:sodium-coupled monocarboxylate transporter 2 [Caerostris darwini]|uniref:Sodium-coupled monocarboxylate transporter 2 n=1 Tax=Caerostris darwini TaxID=1538125 RepID=A0AAV4SHM8_9ARAC|nr:sodium-coupled monocarboxylate transporter 2 [Caerostris darwini]